MMRPVVFHTDGCVSSNQAMNSETAKMEWKYWSTGRRQGLGDAMPYLGIAALSIAAALLLCLSNDANAAPVGAFRPAVEVCGVASELLIKTQTQGIDRRGDRRTDRHDRRNNWRRY